MKTRSQPPREPRATLPLVRCAIYTRKSTEEGLEQEFNTLDAQRESGEAFVRSQAAEGWTCLPDRYDDGGFTGGNMDRPALQRLLADVEAGKVDCVVVYKVDRLSRSLLDFAKILEAFDRRGVSFVAVTQQINSGTSMGRLMLNVLLSFAQFEREIIAERTRDKIAATRRKGKWSGGRPLLGFDVDPGGRRLSVNEAEAERVRAIFALFLEHGSLPPVVRELQRRGWANKRWTTRSGRACGGEPFTKAGLRRLLSNVLYVGQVRYKDELHDGEQPALVDPAAFRRARELLHRRGRRDGPPARNPLTPLLRGLLRCAPCGCAMTPAHSAKGVRRYRYYVCTAAQKRGWDTCPSKSVPAGEVERLVLDRLRALARDPALLGQLLAQARQHEEGRGAALESEQRGLERDLAGWQAEVRNLSLRLCPGGDNSAAVARLADLQERISRVEGRVRQVREQLRAAREHLLDEGAAATALALFEPHWEALAPAEQARVVALLVQRVDYDGAQGKLSITFRPDGIQALADELAGHHREERA
jgi:site-specific DNA recombinase